MNKVLRSFLLTSLRSKFLQSCLLISLRNGFLQSSPLTITSIQSKPELGSPLTFLRKLFLQHLYEGISTIVQLLLSLLVCLRNGILQSSLLVSLRSTPVRTCILSSLWNIFLQRLYKNVSTIIHTVYK